ncbi:MAG: hypothetical protein ACYCQJ_12305 [Nitrososphaerales archaeon]
MSQTLHWVAWYGTPPTTFHCDCCGVDHQTECYPGYYLDYYIIDDYHHNILKILCNACTPYRDKPICGFCVKIR